ncbi:MAG TPA: DUF4352 domain-containing protein [Mycobacterium sp.]|nr:DUF4352 domain-containing protein [Mycobacterium sp.]
MKRFVIALAVLASLVAGCAAKPAHLGKPAGPPLTVTTPPPKTAAHLGQTLDLMRIGDQRIAVTMLQVINPATVPNGWGDPSKNYMAAKLTITNTGTTTIVGNSSSDVVLVGSDNKDYHADLATVTECKDFVYGWFLLPAGVSQTGCVTFALPSGVTPAKVKYTPSSGIAREIGEWPNS